MPDLKPETATTASTQDIRTEHAAPDGLPLYIGYGPLEVLSPDGRHRTRWQYDSEPPHGDSLNLVWLDGIRLPGRYWGRGHAWSPPSPDSPASCCFTVERFDAGHSTLYLVRAPDRHWLKLDRQASTLWLRYPQMTCRSYGDAQPARTRTLTGQEAWKPIPP